MTTKFRTLLLLGLTAFAASLSGCILETSSGSGGYGGPSGGTCLDSQYFVVQWEVDNGTNTTPLACDQISAHVELTLNTVPATILTIPVQTCDNRLLYNFAGYSNTRLAVGTAVVSASLISDSSATAGTVLSTAGIPPNLQYPIVACTSTVVSFQFPLQ
jgi:hypothetical protein